MGQSPSLSWDMTDFVRKLSNTGHDRHGATLSSSGEGIKEAHLEEVATQVAGETREANGATVKH